MWRDIIYSSTITQSFQNHYIFPKRNISKKVSFKVLQDTVLDKNRQTWSESIEKSVPRPPPPHKMDVKTRTGQRAQKKSLPRPPHPPYV